MTQEEMSLQIMYAYIASFSSPENQGVRALNDLSVIWSAFVLMQDYFLCYMPFKSLQKGDQV